MSRGRKKRIIDIDFVSVCDQEKEEAKDELSGSIGECENLYWKIL